MHQTLQTQPASQSKAEDHVSPVAPDLLACGMAILQQVGGKGFDGPIKRLAQVSPDMADLTVAYPYGHVLSRPGLDLWTRQVCTISCLITQGSAQSQLKFHMEGLLNVGGRPQDLVDIIFLSTAVLGFPAAINATGIIRQIFSEREIPFTPSPPDNGDGTDRWQNGVEAFHALMGMEAEDYTASFAHVSAELARWSLEFIFGDVLSREGLESKVKHLAVVTMLATAGNRTDTLRAHLRGARHCGATSQEAIEVLIQISVYAGFPAALNAFTAASDIVSSWIERPDNMPADPRDAPASENRAQRRARGLAVLAATSGPSGEAVVGSFDDIAPDVGRMIVEHSYGDIFARPGIDPKIRELTACAALAAQGTVTTETPLRVHINAALNVGASHAEVLETLLNVVAYSGYPAAQRAMALAGEEFAKR